MKRDATGPALSAIFIDYDNIYLSLKRKNEDAAKRFAKDAALWIREIETGRLIRPTAGYSNEIHRRIVLNRCYGNPVPRRNSHDNSTDMNSFPFVRHNFLRAGSEVIDCPPLTAQLKNSADIRIVMDVRDMLTHDTYFDEFIILSGDADFTPLLHRLRSHARRTVIFANDRTASPYTAISDGEVREEDLLALLLDGRLQSEGTTPSVVTEEPVAPLLAAKTPIDMSALRREIVGEVAALVRAAGQPVPLEALADRLVRQLGHEKTAGSGWGGTGSFRDLVATYLPEDLRMTDQPPFLVFDSQRQIAVAQPQVVLPPAGAGQTVPDRVPAQQMLAPLVQRSTGTFNPVVANTVADVPVAPRIAPQAGVPAAAPLAVAPAPVAQPAAQPARPQGNSQALAIQQAVAKIYEACQAPPLSPPEYRILFDVMAEEITVRGLTGAATLDNVSSRSKELGVQIGRDDVRFVLEVVSEEDPWFEQGAVSNVFASRFRNFVVARCRSHGLALSLEELDLIDHWFAGQVGSQAANTPQRAAPGAGPNLAAAPAVSTAPAQQGADSWWSMDQTGGQGQPAPQEEFPRIIRSRMRG